MRVSFTCQSHSLSIGPLRYLRKFDNAQRYCSIGGYGIAQSSNDLLSYSKEEMVTSRL